MVRSNDEVLSILRRIEADIAAIKRDIAKIAARDQTTPRAGFIDLDRLAPEIVEAFRKEGEAVKQRLRSLETQA